MVWFGSVGLIDVLIDSLMGMCECVSVCVCAFLRSRLLVCCSNLFIANSFDVIELTIIWLGHKCHTNTHTYPCARTLHLYGILYLTQSPNTLLFHIICVRLLCVAFVLCNSIYRAHTAHTFHFASLFVFFSHSLYANLYLDSSKHSRHIYFVFSYLRLRCGR